MTVSSRTLPHLLFITSLFSLLTTTHSVATCIYLAPETWFGGVSVALALGTGYITVNKLREFSTAE